MISFSHGNCEERSDEAIQLDCRGRLSLPRKDKRKMVHARLAFALVELIVVMVLLLIVASLAAPRMSSFYRGRALSQEARRMLSLVNYAQSRAVAEGVPVLLWIDSQRSTYGLEVIGGQVGGDDRLTE